MNIKNKIIEIKENELGLGDWGLGIGPNPQSPIILKKKLLHI
jgi:hypothetical protein